jgi:hypothetical protein
MFATFDNHHHGAPHVGVWLAMPLGAQEALVYQDPKRFFVPPYVGPRGWVGVRLDNRPSWKTVERVVREAHAFIKNKNPLPQRGEGRVRGRVVRGREDSPLGPDLGRERQPLEVRVGERRVLLHP